MSLSKASEAQRLAMNRATESGLSHQQEMRMATIKCNGLIKLIERQWQKMINSKSKAINLKLDQLQLKVNQSGEVAAASEPIAGPSRSVEPMDAGVAKMTTINWVIHELPVEFFKSELSIETMNLICDLNDLLESCDSNLAAETSGTSRFYLSAEEHGQAAGPIAGLSTISEPMRLHGQMTGQSDRNLTA